MSDFITKDSGHRDNFDTGAVRDSEADKGDFSLLPYDPLVRLAKLYYRGSIKYTAENWREGFPFRRTLSSLRRHAMQYGNEFTEDHLAAVVFNAFCLMEYEERIKTKDMSNSLNNLYWLSDGHGGKVTNLIGQKFGRLTVLSFVSRDDKHVKWLCECICGNKVEVLANNLKKGNSKSCGCLAKELTSARSSTHRMSNTPEYGIWRAIQDRCYNKTHISYDNYGGRGIIVCDRWRENFENFIEDMGNRPLTATDIDRLDNDGPYSPENCVWTTRKDNSQHKRTNRELTLNGVTKNATQWAELYGHRSGYIISRRIDRDGWSVEKAIITPSRRQEDNIEPLEASVKLDAEKFVKDTQEFEEAIRGIIQENLGDIHGR